MTALFGLQVLEELGAEYAVLQSTSHIGAGEVVMRETALDGIDFFQGCPLLHILQGLLCLGGRATIRRLCTGQKPGAPRSVCLTRYGI
jgi:hypothetical protein